MSTVNEISLTCTKCGHKQVTEIWNSINATVTPEARQQLFDGQINVFTCSNCGGKQLVNTHLMYHDMTRKFAAWYWPFSFTEDSEFLSRFALDGTDMVRLKSHNDMISEYPQLPVALEYLHNPHTVFNLDELIRYVLFRERLFEFRTKGVN